MLSGEDTLCTVLIHCLNICQHFTQQGVEESSSTILQQEEQSSNPCVGKHPPSWSELPERDTELQPAPGNKRSKLSQYFFSWHFVTLFLFWLPSLSAHSLNTELIWLLILFTISSSVEYSIMIIFVKTVVDSLPEVNTKISCDH